MLAATAIIVLVGIALGFAVFRLTRGSTEWPVSVEKTAHGWRVSSPLGEPQTLEALTDDHLVWSNGAYLEVLDLETGKVVLLQRPVADAEGREMGVLATSVCDRHVAWTNLLSDGSRQELRVCNLESGEQRVVATAAYFGSVFVSTRSLVWQKGDRIHLEDLETGVRQTVVTGAGIQLSDVEAELVAWTQTDPTADSRVAHPIIYVYDGATGGVEHFDVGVPVASFLGLTLADQAIIWQVEVEGAPGPLYARTLNGGGRTLVTREITSGGYVVAAGSVIWSEGRGDRRFWTKPSSPVRSGAGWKPWSPGSRSWPARRWPGRRGGRSSRRRRLRLSGCRESRVFAHSR